MSIHTMATQTPAVTAASHPLPPTGGSPAKSSQEGTTSKKTGKSGEAQKTMDRLLQRDRVRGSNSNSELHEELRKLLGHLHAQTMLISGEGMENFFNHSDQIKSDYLWAMCDTAERAMKLLDDAC